MQKLSHLIVRILLSCLCLWIVLAAFIPAQAAPDSSLNDPAELEAFLDGVIGTEMGVG